MNFTQSYQEILDFWFADGMQSRWYVKDKEFDALIIEKFLPAYQDALEGKLESWKDSISGVLALIILYDQFPRNMFRGRKQSFATDGQARELTYFSIHKNLGKNLPDEKKQFLYMPLMHSETLQDQELSVQLFSKFKQLSAYDYAVRHKDIIAQFGRFPHRNIVLDRGSTREEIEFLKTSNSSF